MQLFYFKNILGDQLVLDKSDARHITKVLRKVVGDELAITDGRGRLYKGIISQVTSNKVVIDLAFAKAEKKPSPWLHVAIAPTKMNDRLEWFLEKSVEIGIQEITLLLCHHSERKKVNLERYERILTSAMQQSKRLWVPVINPLVDFNSFVESQNPEHFYIAHCENSSKDYLQDRLHSGFDATILIGPEGDFSKVEIEHALRYGAIPVALGDSRLRTETAGIYAVTAFNITQNRST